MDENTIMELGKIAGLQYVLVGSLDSLGRREYRSDMIIVRGSMTTVEEKYEINIRMLDVATGEVCFSFSEGGSASEVYTHFSNASSRESGALKSRAIRDGMSRLTKRVSEALNNEFTYSSLNQ